MNLEYYSNFLKIVEVGTISKAAEELLIAQPSLSKQIQLLEKQFGTPLLKRGTRNVELTAIGQMFYEKVKLICSLNNMLQEEVHSSILGNKGRLRIGVTLSYPDLFAEAVFQEFSSLYPEIVYEIHETSSDEIMNLLKNNIIEIGLVRTPSYINPIFKSYKGVEETLMAVFHKDNPWIPTNIDAIPIKMLKGIPLSISRGFQNKVFEICSEEGFSPNLLSISSSRPTTIMWARMMKAVGLITTTSHKILETDILRCRPLTGGDVLAKRTFTVLKKRELSSVAKSFLNFATVDAAF